SISRGAGVMTGFEYLQGMPIRSSLRRMLHPAGALSDRVPGVLLAEATSSPPQLFPKLSTDGRALLERFFLDVPRPRDLGELLLIHERCRRLVPEAWAGNSLFYRVEVSPPPSAEGLSELLVFGTFIPALESPRRIEGALRRLFSLSPRACDVRFLFAFR